MVPGYEAWERGLALRQAGSVDDAIEAFKVAGESGLAEGYVELATSK
jgi:hypothetical protein